MVDHKCQVAYCITFRGVAYGMACHGMTWHCFAGDAEQAEGFHRRALRAREVAHGPDHPDMPVLLSNLAGTLYIQVSDGIEASQPIVAANKSLNASFLVNTAVSNMSSGNTRAPGVFSGARHKLTNVRSKSKRKTTS